MDYHNIGWRLAVASVVLVVGVASVAEAQGRGDVDGDRQPSGATVLGDTGLWFVPTGEILPSGHWSISTFRVNTDRQQGFTDVSHFAGGAAIGIKNRLELFGSMNARTRIDRDLRPLVNDAVPAAGGLDSDYPFVRDGFTQGRGDLSLGAKLNLLSERRGHPAALAIRSVVKLPTGDTHRGVTTGETDVIVDAIASRRFGSVEVAALGGAIARGDARDAELPNGVRWALGAGFPAPARFRVITEVRGEVALDGDLVTPAPLVARDGSLAPLRSLVRNPVDTMIGLTWTAPSGVSIGAGVSWAARFSGRDRFGLPATSERGDRFGFQMGIGFRPGGRVAALPPADPPAARVNQGPSVAAHCDPCRVEPRQTATVRAEATDPDGDPLSYRWRAPAGQLAPPTGATTTWTAPDREGPVVVTVEVDDDRGGRATDTVMLDVVASARPLELVFEDVHFDFDRATLRPAAVRVLDEAVKALTATPTMRVTIDGHTCNIGTSEYNIALADRRARAVREYLVGRGIDGERLRTVAYGEDRPTHDNLREETRRLNRRAALVVELAVASRGE